MSSPFCYAEVMVKKSRKVIVYGDSLVLEGVCATLAGFVDIQVIPLNSPGHTLAKEILVQNPVALIFDTSAGQPDFPSVLLQQPDLLLIGIDPETHKAMVWSGRQAAAIEATDLLNVIRGKYPTRQKGHKLKINRR